MAATVVTIASALCLLIPRDGLGRFVLMGAVVLLYAAVLATGRRTAGIAAMVLGVVGVSVGIARGLRFLTAGQPDPLAWLALVAAVAGLMLIVIGLAHAAAGWRWWSKSLMGVTVAIVAALGLFTLAIPLAATDPPRAAVTSAAPQGWSEVGFPARDGVILSGWYTPGSKGAGVVVVPGSGSSRSGALTQAQALAEGGFAVLVYDPRGHGQSAGVAMDLGWAGDQDVCGAVDFLAAKGVRRIGALGLSMGGEQVLGAAGADPRIAAVAAEGATHRTGADYAWLSDEFGWRGSLQKAINAPRFALVDVLAAQDPPTPLAEAVRTISPRPVLLIAAGTVQDEALAIAYIAEDTQAQTWVIANSGHIAGLVTDPAAWTQRVVGFFDESLDP